MRERERESPYTIARSERTSSCNNGAKHKKTRGTRVSVNTTVATLMIGSIFLISNQQRPSCLLRSPHKYLLVGKCSEWEQCKNNPSQGFQRRVKERETLCPSKFKKRPGWSLICGPRSGGQMELFIKVFFYIYIKIVFFFIFLNLYVRKWSSSVANMCKEGAPPHSFFNKNASGWLHNPFLYTFRLKVSSPFVIRRSSLCSSFENSSSNCTCRVRCTLNMPASCLVSPSSCALL